MKKSLSRKVPPTSHPLVPHLTGITAVPVDPEEPRPGEKESAWPFLLNLASPAAHMLDSWDRNVSSDAKIYSEVTLEFVMLPTTDSTLQFEYVFGSNEYLK